MDGWMDGWMDDLTLHSALWWCGHGRVAVVSTCSTNKSRRKWRDCRWVVRRSTVALCRYVYMTQ